MDLISIVLVIMVSIGIILTFVAVFIVNEKDNVIEIEGTGLDETIDTLEKKLDEADFIFNNIEDYSKDVFAQLDSKYEEVLELYSLIQEKEQDFDLIYKNQMINNKLKIEAEKISTSRDEKVQTILGYHEQGFSDLEIARTMEIGQGEVNLLIGISKR